MSNLVCKQARELKSNVEVLNSNLHRVKIGHAGMANDYSTQSKQILVDQKRMSTSPYVVNSSIAKPKVSIYSSNFELGHESGVAVSSN